MKKVVFVCTANYYRSRFAEAFFNYSKGSELNGWWAESRGLMIECAPASLSPHTKDAIEQLSIPEECYQKFPVALNEEDLESVDLVIALKEEEHKPMMREQFPEWADKIRYWQVHDLDVWGPEQTLPAIQIQVGLLIQEFVENFEN